MNTSQNCLILFAKSPQKGKVKTRLEKVLGKDAALQIYLKLLQKQVALVESCSFSNPRLWIDGDDSHDVFNSLRGKGKQQRGSNLGERMANALNAELSIFKNVVLVGSDCPEMDNLYIHSAFELLESGKDIVLGPACDGGYVLIGMQVGKHNFEAALFEEIPWGSADVISATVNTIKKLNLDFGLLEPLSDLDDPSDLAKFPDLALTL